ncbi:hypothetical protein HETIRDRAFT_386468 [Heterobasidion irregulare TC 32-1]|uniref:Uncharacterized protein n=1 Tax=Heterobasidion irregulare (strain TC 32-1) TaxID=747525 RepID=W4K3J5_HETIT|nr:uncharacterized protein HETIRDRAFT_386468 [Heterobasidion irregulare TC 32-1]ETW79910.1 hypothetical protein HETIRDRAFT_386468 [Heterobasidion irregulare TC 32-1]
MMLTLADKFWIWVKSVYLRISLNRFTQAFFILSFIFCFAQSITQSFLFSLDDEWRGLVSNVVDHGNLNKSLFVQYTGRHGQYSLALCNDSPMLENACVPYYTSGQMNVSIPYGFKREEYDGRLLSQTTWDRWISPQGIPVNDIVIQSIHGSDGMNVRVSEVRNSSNAITLSPQCIRTLLYPDQKLQEFRREVLALIASQFWLFGLSVFAILRESVPHLLALLGARFLGTGWSAYTLWRTGNIEDRIHHLIEQQDTPCHLDVFSPYFRMRMSFQIPDLVLHCTALAFSLFLSWRLLKVYNAQTFKRVGPPTTIIRVYRYYLTSLVCLQLSVFFLVVAMSLWVDQLLNSAIKEISEHTDIYIALFTTTTVLLLPWITMGWYSVRREKKGFMLAFSAVGFIFISCWAIMFYSRIYRFTFVDWPFFGCMTVSSFVVMILSIVFGIINQLHFKHGLKQYLDVEETMARSDFDPQVFNHSTSKEWKEETSVARFTIPILLSDSASFASTSEKHGSIV